MTDLAQRLEPIETRLAAMYLGFFLAGCFILFRIIRDHGRQLRTEWPDSVRTLAARPWQWTDPAYVIVPTLLLGGAFAFFARGHIESGRFLPIAIALLLTHAPIFIAAACILAVRRTGPRAAFGIERSKFPRDLALGAVLYLAMIALVFPTMIATDQIMRLLGHEPTPQDIVSLFANQKGVFPKIFIAIWTMLVAPIAEEIIFRGILLPLLLRKLSAGLAIAIVSIAFALLHGDATAFLPLFAVSASLSLAYIATRSLTVTIVLHALFNSVTTAILLLTG